MLDIPLMTLSFSEARPFSRAELARDADAGSCNSDSTEPGDFHPASRYFFRTPVYTPRVLAWMRPCFFKRLMIL